MLDTLPPSLWLPMLLVLIGLGFLTAFAKAATIDINDARLSQLAEEKENARKLYERLTKAPATMLGGLDCAGTLFAAISAVLFGRVHWETVHRMLTDMGLPETTLTGLLVLLLLGLAGVLGYLVLWDLVPKRLAAKYAEPAALFLSGYTRFISLLARPFLWFCTLIANGIARLFGVRPHDLEEEVTEEEIRMMVDMGLESGAIDDDEKEMIHNIFEMDDTQVQEIMTHRTEACILWLEDSLEDWKAYIDETNHTRYPVCDEDVDNVVGVVNSRDFYRFMLNGGKKEEVSSIFRTPHFVPDTMKADELFSRMQEKNTHMVVVLDEYGGFQGLATQEDLLEEIVGELYSEYDEPEKIEEIVALGENVWNIKGAAEIEKVEEALGTNLPEGDYNTFAGLILEAIGTLPEDGETLEITIGNLEIQVTSVADHRIEDTIVKVVEPVEDEEEEPEE